MNGYHLHLLTISDCPKRVTYSANLEKHCEESGHSADVESESRFIRAFFAHYATATSPPDLPPPSTDAAGNASSVVSVPTGSARKTKRKGKEKEFKLDDVPWNLRPFMDEELNEYITSRKVSSMVLWVCSG